MLTFARTGVTDHGRFHGHVHWSQRATLPHVCGLRHAWLRTKTFVKGAPHSDILLSLFAPACLSAGALFFFVLGGVGNGGFQSYRQCLRYRLAACGKILHVTRAML